MKFIQSLHLFKYSRSLYRQTCIASLCSHSFGQFIRSQRPVGICVTSQHTRMASTASQLKHVYNDIVKSAEDDRIYRGLELTNGMKILLIHDATTEKASAAMDVHIGHMSDPKDLPGLAHFCEHMLFLGTEKYPEENAYNKFLNEHGGSSNAFTSPEHTNYYFDVAAEHLQGALDRFAQFFLCPLFTASATDREVNAVNSENDKNLQSDAWRLMQIDKSTADPNHDYSKFGTGNKDTLDILPKERGVNTRDELLKFHKKWYSSNIMALSILGQESLDELQDMVVGTFSEVANKDVTIPEWPQHPYGPDQVKKKAEIVPVKDIRSLAITWPIPDLFPYYKSSPGHYLGHLIGHEGPGSLLSELKNKGWVNQIVGGEKAGAKGFMFFILNVDLSEEGLDHTNDIVTLVFQYLNMLRKEGPMEWIFQECKDLNAMKFRFKEKSSPRNYTSSTAALLHDYPMNEVLCGTYLMEDFRPDLVNMVLEKLTPDNIRVAVVGKMFEGRTTQKEEWYGTDFSLEPIPEDTLQKWRNAGLHENLKLPMRNEFIPTNFDIMPRDEENQAIPQVIKDTSLSRLWYRQDDKFLLPKAIVSMELTSSYAYIDPLSTNMTQLFTMLFQDALNEYTYDADLAGLKYQLVSSYYGLKMSVSGYNDKLHILLQKVMEKMVSFKIDQQRFDVLKELYVRSLRNFMAEQPHQHAVYYTSVLTSEQLWTNDELLDATDELTVERLQMFIPQLLSRLYLEFLVYGNVTRQAALQAVDIVEQALSKGCTTKPLALSQQRRFREVQMPDGCYYLYRRHNSVHRSSSLEVYYQCSVQETNTNMLLELFCQIIAEPCFDILRTQEQLGYIVFSGLRRACGVQGLRVIVQSDKSPDFVERRIEAFLLKMATYLDEMTDVEFKKHVEALATKRLEKPKRLREQHSRYWSEIVSQQYNFDRDSVEVAHLRSLTKDDIVGFYRELIAHNAPRRHKLSVHILSTANGAQQQQEAGDGDAQLQQQEQKSLDGMAPSPHLPQAIEVTDVTAFKRELPLFPLPKPYMKVAKSKL